MPTKSHLLFPATLGKSPTISKPYWLKGQGLDRRLRTPPSWWMLEANFWHWSHFFMYSNASLCILSHQYPYIRVIWDKDLPPVWLPQIPSCNSSWSSSIALGWMHSKYGPEKERLYNFWSSDSQNHGAFLCTLLSSLFSSGKMSSLRNRTIGSIQLGPPLVDELTFFLSISVRLHNSRPIWPEVDSVPRRLQEWKRNQHAYFCFSGFGVRNKSQILITSA